METLRQKSVTGLFWSGAESLVRQGLSFAFGVVLARLLSPKEFGLIGLVSIFIALAQTFTDSGFSESLIRKQNCSDRDYSTVLIFNLVVGLFFYGVIYTSANIIASFFNEPDLVQILRVLSIVLIINALCMVQRTILIKKVDFKKQTSIALYASILSGSTGVILALNNFGVWSLIIRSLLYAVIEAVLLWRHSAWKLTLCFSIRSFHEMFGFGSKLLAASLINTLYNQINHIVIGRYFSVKDLGFFTRAEQFANLPCANISNAFQRVTYPLLASIRENRARLKNAYRKTVSHAMFLSSVSMLLLAALARPVIVGLVGEKWIASVEYLQILSLQGVLFPLHAINLNVLKVFGRGDLFLWVEVLKKIMLVPVIIIGVFCGIKAMLWASLVSSLLSLLVNSVFSNKLVGYSVWEQMSDILPAIMISSSVSIGIFFISDMFESSSALMLVAMALLGIGSIALIAKVGGLAVYTELESAVCSKIRGKTF